MLFLFIVGCSVLQDVTGKAALTSEQCSKLGTTVIPRLHELKSIKGCPNSPLCTSINEIMPQLANIYQTCSGVSSGGAGGLLPGDCTDSDADSGNGDSLFVSGSATAAGIIKADYCAILEDSTLTNIKVSGYKQGNLLVEYYCENNVIAEHHVVGACADGALIDYTGGTVPAGSVCYDSDPNRQKLIVTSRGTQSSVRTISGEWYTDACFLDSVNQKWLKWDYYCDANTIAVEKKCSCDRDTGTALMPEQC